MNEAYETAAFWFGFKYQSKVLSQQKKKTDENKEKSETNQRKLS